MTAINTAAVLLHFVVGLTGEAAEQIATSRQRSLPPTK